jgi:hypothetical protein
MASVLGFMIFFSLIAVVTLCLMARNKSGCFAPREYVPSTSEEKAPLGRGDDEDEELESRSGSISEEEVRLESASA